MRFELSPTWITAYPDAHAGVLAMRDVTHPPMHNALEARKVALEAELRQRYAGQDRAALLHNPILHAYEQYYKQFKKTYHVQLQLESILYKGKSIPSVAALVDCMFMAEMDGLLLTAGHDLDAAKQPLGIDVADGTEVYTLLRGEPQTTKAGDMLIRDYEGIISSIVYGPDQRTQINTQTRNVVFTIYAPAGINIEDVRLQLAKIRDNVLLVSPDASVELLDVYGAA